MLRQEGLLGAISHIADVEEAALAIYPSLKIECSGFCNSTVGAAPSCSQTASVCCWKKLYVYRHKLFLQLQLTS